MQIKITSSTLTEETFHTVPASITIFTREQIQQLGVSTLENLMNYVPGYQSYQSDLGVPIYSVRSRRITPAAREILILLDGVRLNRDSFGNASLFEANLTLDNVSRVEFIRGPGSAIYGANAFLGVVNIVTLTDKNQVSVGVGDPEHNKISLNANHEFENGLKTSIFMQDFKSKSDQQAIYSTVTATFADAQQKNENKNLYVRASWGELSLQARHEQYSHYGDYVIGFVSDYGHLDAATNIFAVNYTHAFSDQWAFDTHLYTTPYELSYRYQRKISPQFSNNHFEGNDSGLENHLTWNDGSKNFLLGVDLVRNQLQVANNQLKTLPSDSADWVEIIKTGSREVTAVYGQWQDAICDQLTYIIGVRNDNYSDVGGTTNPRLGLLWQMNKTNSFKLLYGEAFRAPAKNELNFNSALQIGNPDLKPEISKTAEIVWVQTGAVHYNSISLFKVNIEDPVLLVNSQPKSTFENNSTPQNMSGIEAEWHWYFTEGWQFRTHASHLINSAIKINSDSENLLSASLIYAGENVTFSLSGHYHGSSRDQNASQNGYRKIDSYTRYDAHMHYQISPQWQAFINVTNLTDDTYLQPAVQNFSNTIGVPSLGREIEVGARWDF